MNRFSSILTAALVAATLGSSMAIATESPVTAEQIAAAKTPAEHAAIAAAYDAEADRLDSMAKKHEAMSRSYRSAWAGQKGHNAAAMSAHCLKLQKSYSDAALENREMAKEHRAMASAKPL